ncbi:hypothetical protein Pan216_12660 [Planctomycetes bacterium Pan216]|uniref:GYF domain-containing protein n=1 Tax=Kolteria novifilia TaxID=2527975 RepID=A0A518B0B4_9BACT|nr:hypothetical protein Pan216_12660 [Planctomycetes bacterium Pan216]
MSNAYYVMIDETPQGPYSKVVIGRLLYEKTITPETPIRSQDAPGWKTLGSNAQKFVDLYRKQGMPTGASWSRADSPEVKPTPQPQRAEPAPARSREYKVLTQKDKWFSGKFDPEKLEEALNVDAWLLADFATLWSVGHRTARGVMSGRLSAAMLTSATTL